VPAADVEAAGGVAAYFGADGRDVEPQLPAGARYVLPSPDLGLPRRRAGER
jgi:hypothetical protein